MKLLSRESRDVASLPAFLYYACITAIKQRKRMPNPRCYFDVSINGHNAGRIVMELFADVVPKTVSQRYFGLQGRILPS